MSVTATVFETELVANQPGFISFIVRGSEAQRLFTNEAGGHRWQRTPPNEKRGRVHTSTVTVAVLPLDSGPPPINLRDVELTAQRGSGPGGQNRNKVESCITAVHRPTGIRVRIDMRDQSQSKTVAIRVLAERVTEAAQARAAADRQQDRRNQLGSGQRGDKRRTYRERDDSVADHFTGQRWSLKQWLRGVW